MNISNGARVNDRLRQERIGRNWRQKDLAEQLGTTVVTIKRWERGHQQPSDYFCVKLCTLFGKSAKELGFVAEGPLLPLVEEDAVKKDQATTSSPAPLALWTVPYLRNPHFTGRDDLLDQLARQLSCEKPHDIRATRRATLSQPLAVRGLGGIGKTQIAVEYAYQAREQGYYTHIFWINAANEEAIITSFLALADILPGLPNKEEKNQHLLITAIKRWLEQCQEPWLLIFDNADELALVQPYLPQQGQGRILLTTRATAVGWLANPIEVEPMELMEGTWFLLHRAQRLYASNEECNEATNVVIALDGFPLALDQAGAYIEETGCSFGDYLYLYEQRHTILLARRGKQAANYPYTVATTWSLSFQKVEQAHPAAAELLRLCAYLSPDHIPEELLTDGAAYWPSLLQHAVVDRLNFNELLETLMAFSLVKRLAQEHLLSLHRLVQVVQMDQMDSQEQRIWAERVVRAVNTLFPTDPREKVETWPQCLRYLEQVQACDGLIQLHHLQLQEAADLLDRAGIYLREHASYSLAEPLFQRALVIAEQRLGSEHSQVASFLGNLGNLYWRQGKYERAETLYQRSLRIREQALGTQHVEVARALNNLGLLYKEQGKYEQAEPLLRQTLHIFEHASDPDSLQIAMAFNNLGILYKRQGKYEQAEPLLQQALQILEQVSGLDHPQLAFPLNNLGDLFREQGKYEQAERLLQRSLQIREHAFGPDHPDVALPLNNLGELSLFQGKYEQAESLLQRAIHVWRQALGPDYPQLAYPLTNLGIVYREQGKYEQAEPVYQQALHIWEQALRPEHPLIVGVLNEQANLYRDQGKYEQARSLYLRVLVLRQLHLSPQHPDLAETLHDLADFHHLLQETAEALSLYQQALIIREQVYGSQHPKTEKTRKAIAVLFDHDDFPGVLFSQR